MDYTNAQLASDFFRVTAQYTSDDGFTWCVRERNSIASCLENIAVWYTQRGKLDELPLEDLYKSVPDTSFSVADVVSMLLEQGLARTEQAVAAKKCASFDQHPFRVPQHVSVAYRDGVPLKQTALPEVMR